MRVKKSLIEQVVREFVNEQTNNSSFSKWFEGSKAKKGNSPIVFLHGTSQYFNTFSRKSRGAFGAGYYFTTDKKEALGYGSKVVKVYLSIKNPATTKDVQAIMTKIPDVRYLDDVELANKTTSGLVGSGFDGIIFNYPSGDLLAMVINPNQIKSVDNDGSWDIDDDNIYS